MKTMRKLFRYTGWIAVGAGVVGALLRLLMLREGPDAEGLYRRNHPAWILLWVLGCAVVVLLFLLSRHAGKSRRYTENFPPSPLAALGTAVGAMGLLAVSIVGWMTTSGVTNRLMNGIGVVAALGLGYSAWCRFHGSRKQLLVHLILCLYFAVRVFNMGRLFGSEPQLSKFVLQFLASAAAMMAVYQLATFDVELGQRSGCVFWSLFAVYYCCTAIPGCEEWLFYATMAIFLLSNMCLLRRPPRRMTRSARAKSAPEPEARPAAAPEPSMPRFELAREEAPEPEAVQPEKPEAKPEVKPEPPKPEEPEQTDPDPDSEWEKTLADIMKLLDDGQP